MKKKVDIFLDSGAYSAFTQGVKIDIYEYIDFIKKHEQYLDVYACLDVIGDPIATWKNQQIMEKAGLNPLVVFHKNEDYSYLKKYAKKYDYIGLGGMAGGITVKELSKHLDTCFDIICDTKDRMPKCKVHGFGLTSVNLMCRYPWYSVDSTTWVMASRTGTVYIPKIKKGKYCYNERAYVISVSSRSPNQKDAGKHFSTMPKMVQEQIKIYLDLKGYDIGSSEFKTVSEKYKLKDNEKWIAKPIDGKREVEIILESGISNDYKQRDELNIIYFLDLEKSFPKWPWPYEKKETLKGFLL